MQDAAEHLRVVVIEEVDGVDVGLVGGDGVVFGEVAAGELVHVGAGVGGGVDGGEVDAGEGFFGGCLRAEGWGEEGEGEEEGWAGVHGFKFMLRGGVVGGCCAMNGHMRIRRRMKCNFGNFARQPQRLKPVMFRDCYGTAEAVPLSNTVGNLWGHEVQIR